MSCGCGNTCTCGCCVGTSVVTPMAEYNAPGLPAIAYRTGTGQHSTRRCWRGSQAPTIPRSPG